jgi:polysaccharide biosynthesis transport protein
MAADMLDRPITVFLEYWSLIRRYRWHVLLGSCALTLIFVIVIARIPNVFEATTTILVNPQQVPEKYVAPAVISDPSARLNTLTQQVLSRTRLQEIIDKFHLYAPLQKTHSPEEIIEGMRHDITIQVKQGSGPELSTFTITYQAKDPGLVATVANELANSFIQWNVHSREMQVSGTKEFLQAELEEARENLQGQEAKLRNFKMSHLGETPDQIQGNLQALSGLRAAMLANQDALNRLDAEKLLLSRLPEPVALAGAGTPVLSDRAQLEAEKHRLEANLQQLRARYSERYPDVVKAERELNGVSARLAGMKPEKSASEKQKPSEVSTSSVRIEVIDKEMKRLAGDQQKLQAQIQSYQSKVDATPLREQQLVELNRNYDTSKQHYQALLDKSFNIDMAADLEQKQKGERFTVLDPARTPTKPVKPRRLLLLGVALLCSVGVSTLWVIGKNTISPSVKTETELKGLLPKGVVVVGLIPSIRIAADDYRERRTFVLATSVSLAMLAAAAVVIWHMRAVL